MKKAQLYYYLVDGVVAIKMKAIILKFDKLFSKLVLDKNENRRKSQSALRKKMSYTETNCYLDMRNL